MLPLKSSRRIVLALIPIGRGRSCGDDSDEVRFPSSVMVRFDIFKSETGLLLQSDTLKYICTIAGAALAEHKSVTRRSHFGCGSIDYGVDDLVANNPLPRL